ATRESMENKKPAGSHPGGTSTQGETVIPDVLLKSVLKHKHQQALLKRLILTLWSQIPPGVWIRKKDRTHYGKTSIN
ncbi:MAG: hypothetical protein WBI19_05500, partial [Prolixibacteraceae bacterium]